MTDSDKAADKAADTKPRTLAVRAEIPLWGLKRGAHAELTDSPYLRQVLALGHLTRIRKADGSEPEPLSDAAVAG